MPVGLLFDAPGMTQAQYEQVRNAVAPGNRAPAGVLYHAAGPTENGWRVMEVWESQEVLQRFVEQKLGQELQRAGLTTQPHIFEITNIMQP